ncbi:MAG: S9 family peptidase [Gemmatimonadetes bacterium]|nr:S9 family peptidase [Gemmatimonadota bacterium]
MRRSRLPLYLALALALAPRNAPAQQPADTKQSPSGVQPPVAPVRTRVDTLHGEVRVDDYFWMRERENPDVRAYLEAENRYTQTMMKGTESFQEKLYQEMLGRIKQTDLTVPVRQGDYFYYWKTEEGKQYRIYARRKGSMDAPEQILLDENQQAEGYRYYDTGTIKVSPDHRLLAFTVDTTGAEYYTLMVRDLSSGKVLPDRVDSVHFAVAWATDNRHLLYTAVDSAQRDDKIMRHALGTAASKDVLVFHEPNVLFELGVWRSKDDRFLFIESSSFTSSETHFLDASRPTGRWRVVQPRTPELLYNVMHQNGRFLIHTNADGASNFKLMEAPVADPARKRWKELIPHRDSVLLEGVEEFRDWLVLFERERALRRIRVRHLRDSAEHYVDFPESVYTILRGSNPEYQTSTLRFQYTSLITPQSVYDYDMAARKLELRKQQEIPSGYDRSQYATERVWAEARDGVRVPLTIVYRKPLTRDGSRPVYLTGYGSYGASSDPSFSTHYLSFLDRGLIVGICHTRGGQELGRWWYEQGKMLNKKNTFTDFIACAEHLVQGGYTASDRLAIRGGSAGGLLMGAVLNLRPELFQVAVADVPFVDVINTMLDASIPLTAQEWEQWGDPHRQDHYAYIRSYSPYDNVERKAYPALLVTTSLNDPRVAYWEPAKWVAKLRATKTDGHLLLLKTNMGAGHGGASGRYDWLREQAFRYAFILTQLGISE